MKKRYNDQQILLEMKKLSMEGTQKNLVAKYECVQHVFLMAMAKSGNNSLDYPIRIRI